MLAATVRSLLRARRAESDVRAGGAAVAHDLRRDQRRGRRARRATARWRAINRVVRRPCSAPRTPAALVGRPLAALSPLLPRPGRLRRGRRVRGRRTRPRGPRRRDPPRPGARPRRAGRAHPQRRHRGPPGRDRARRGPGARAHDLPHAAAEPAARAPAAPSRRCALDAWHIAAEKELIVGGDWYDVIETGDSVWLVIGDVAGHGVAAATQAGQLRHSLRVYAHEGFGLSEACRRLNELVIGTQLDGHGDDVHRLAGPRHAGELRLVRAGHPPPLLIRAGGEPELLEGSRASCSAWPAAVCEEYPITLDVGDRLVLYTDGLIERPGDSLDDGARAAGRRGARARQPARRSATGSCGGWSTPPTSATTSRCCSPSASRR